MKIEFEKQFGKGVDPWYAKAERWAKKQKFPISFLALGLIAYLKKVWINVKIENGRSKIKNNGYMKIDIIFEFSLFFPIKFIHVLSIFSYKSKKLLFRSVL